MIKIKNIHWDCDDELVYNLLPKQVLIPSNIEEDEIADYLSDKYGFCLFGFEEE